MRPKSRSFHVRLPAAQPRPLRRWEARLVEKRKSPRRIEGARESCSSLRATHSKALEAMTPARSVLLREATPSVLCEAAALLENESEPSVLKLQEPE